MSDFLMTDSYTERWT